MNTVTRTVALCCSASLVMSCDGSADGLVGSEVRTGHCVSSGPNRPWSERVRQVTEFGMDTLHLPAGSSTAVITSIRLAGIEGRIAIRRAVLVPGEAIGDGFKWGDPRGIIYPAEWAARMPVPNATLHYTDPSAHPGYPPLFDGRTWKIVVGLTPGAEGGGAAHLEASYTIGVHSFTYTGNQAVGMYPTAKQCDRFLEQYD